LDPRALPSVAAAAAAAVEKTPAKMQRNLSMTQSIRARGEAMLKQNEVHPLVEKLTVGLKIYSQNLMQDFWLVYKNSHIVVSCWAVHAEHNFNSNERFWVLICSLMFAFGLEGMIAGLIGATQECEGNMPVDSDFFHFFCSEGTNRMLRNYLVFPATSMVIQITFDNFSTFVVSCGCVQHSVTGVKACFEGLGKVAFGALGLFAVTFLGVGIAMTEQSTAEYEENGESGPWVGVFVKFIVTKIATFLTVTSAMSFGFFYYARRSQVINIIRNISYTRVLIDCQKKKYKIAGLTSALSLSDGDCFYHFKKIFSVLVVKSVCSYPAGFEVSA